MSIWLQISAIKVSPDHFRRILHINPFDTPSHFQSGLCRKPVQSASSSNVSRVSTPISRSYELLNHTSSNLNEAHCQAPFETKDYAPIEPLFSQEITSLEGAPDLAIFNGPLLYEFVMPTPVGLIPPLSSPSHPSSNGTCTQLPSFVKNLISPDTAEIKQNTYVPWNPPDSTCFSIKSPAFPTSHLVTSNSYLRQFYHRTQNKYVSSPPLPSHFATLSAPLTATAMFERVPNNLTTATVKQECKRVMPNVVCVGDQSTILPGPSGAGQVAERQEIRADESNRLSMVHMRPTLNVLDGREGSGGSEFNASKNGYDYPDILNELPLRSDKLFDGHIISENQEFNRYCCRS
ncbi:unnamed protein product [Protopolystoma xenopodis]|uniref:Uncharacterized protein n=1 Tax=Protopolystoma xenopodis TaxID=117903 RepID=A0A3S5ALJ9_9PLAT|nr:unnamed protein product [Protopolystoma xenopodis]